MSGVLYISYDGMLEPLGQSQVLAYLERLADGRKIHLISFEKACDWGDIERRTRIARRIDSAGIVWHPRRYHKRFSVLATTYDIAIGTLTALWLRLRHRLRVLHSRSDVATLMAWIVARATGARLIFDMRGFWADERVDGGLWPRNGRLYRVARWLERRLLISADHVVSLTNAAVKLLQADPSLRGRLPPITVIPTCVDLGRFTPVAHSDAGGALVLGYVGSAGTWYLFDATATCIRLLLESRPDARVLVLNRGEHDFIRARLAVAGVPTEKIEMLALEYEDVAREMAGMHAGVFFIRPALSKQASAPTKLAEFLACGIPCLTNAGVGDVADILEGERVGVALRDFSDEAMRSGLRRLSGLLEEPDIRQRCAAVARRLFSVDDGAARYRAIYESFDD